MTLPIQSAQVFTDVQSLDKLRYGSDKNSPETLRFVAEQFEAIFLQMMLKSAHGEGDQQDGMFDSQQSEFYQDWHDKQLAINLASGKGVGIADMLVKQLQKSPANIAAKSSTENNTTINSDTATQKAFDISQLLRRAASVSMTGTTKATSVAVDPAQPATSLDSKQSQASTKPSAPIQSPEAFVQQLWPHAQQAAKALGVKPEVILAQAALETGWGKKITQGPSGENSYNVFNIKADGRWQGDRVTVPTLEYRDGVAVRETAQFRAYDSYQESFADFVKFMQSSPRYQTALSVAADAKSFTQELSAAGYATDPDYATKIMKIASGQPLQDAMAAVKI